MTITEILAEARNLYDVFGKPDKALVLVERALKTEPEHVEALNLKGEILFIMERDDAAIAAYQLALSFEPHSVEALHGMAEIANEHETYTEALHWVERGFLAIPDDPYPEFIENEDYRQRLIAELYNEKATALWHLGRHVEATELLTVDAPKACPIEVEYFEDLLDELEHGEE
jgi:tetratricopeptide (TPR) repeat protein